MATTGTLSRPYWFDTCSFTEVRRVYPRDNFEAVWLLIEELVEANHIRSVEDVYLELQAQDDDLAIWAQVRRQHFLRLDEPIQREARNILGRFPTLIDLRSSRTSSSADPFLIACAVVHGGTVVTQEGRSGGPPKVKIPDVCDQLGISCIRLLDVLRNEGLRS